MAMRVPLMQGLPKRISGFHELIWHSRSLGVILALKAKRVEIFSEETLVHVDEEILGLPQPTRITAELFNSPITVLK